MTSIISGPFRVSYAINNRKRICLLSDKHSKGYECDNGVEAMKAIQVLFDNCPELNFEFLLEYAPTMDTVGDDGSQGPMIKGYKYVRHCFDNNRCNKNVKYKWIDIRWNKYDFVYGFRKIKSYDSILKRLLEGRNVSNTVIDLNILLYQPNSEIDSSHHMLYQVLSMMLNYDTKIYDTMWNIVVYYFNDEVKKANTKKRIEQLIEIVAVDLYTMCLLTLSTCTNIIVYGGGRHIQNYIDFLNCMNYTIIEHGFNLNDKEHHNHRCIYLDIDLDTFFKSSN